MTKLVRIGLGSILLSFGIVTAALAQTPTTYTIANGTGTNLTFRAFQCSGIFCTGSVPMDYLGSPLTGVAGSPSAQGITIQGMSGGQPVIVNCTIGCGASGGTASNFGSAFPSLGTAVGMSQGGNMVAFTGTSNNLNVNIAASGATVPVSGTFWQATQPISAVSLPLPTGAATSANQPTNAAIGSTTSGQTGTLSLAAASTSAPSLTNGQSNPFSLDLSGNLRVNCVTGCLGGGGGGTNSNFGSAFPAAGTAIGLTNGTNMIAWSATSNYGTSPGAIAVPSVNAAVTNSVTVAQGTAANLNATVVGTGTFAVQAAQSGSWMVNPATAANWAIGATGAAVPANAQLMGMSQSGNTTALTGTSGNLNVQCANCSGSGVSTADETAFTAGSSLFAGAGGFFQTTATNNALTSGQQGMFQVTANRALFTNLRNASGTEIGTSSSPVRTDPTGTTTQPVSAASLPLPTGAATSANQPTNAAIGSTTSGETGTLAMGAVTTAAPTYTTAQTNPLSLTTGGALRSDNASWAGTALGAPSNYGTSPGAVAVPGVNAFITNTPSVAQSGTWTVQPGNTANTTAWLMNVGQFGGSNVVTGTGASGAGIPRVTISSDSSLAANQSVNLNQIAGAAPSATNPLWVAAAQAASTTMQNAAVANGNGTNLTVTGFQSALVNVNCSVACSGSTTINFEGTDSTGTFFSVAAYPVAGNGAAVTNATTTGQYWVPTAGLTSLRARISGYSAGTITVTGTPVNGHNAQLAQVVNGTLGQQTAAASSPVTLASDKNISSTPYPIGATPITASTTGTTAATTATLAGSASVTTYICGFSIRANATAAATGNATVTGTVSGTLNFTQWTAPLASGLGVTEMVFNPCVPANATNTSIAVVSAAPGSGGVVSSTAWGYRL